MNLVYDHLKAKSTQELYPRTNEPFELDEIVYIMYEQMYGVPIVKIAQEVKRSPESLERELGGLRDKYKEAEEAESQRVTRTRRKIPQGA